MHKELILIMHFFIFIFNAMFTTDFVHEVIRNKIRITNTFFGSIPY